MIPFFSDLVYANFSDLNKGGNGAVAYNSKNLFFVHIKI